MMFLLRMLMRRARSQPMDPLQVSMTGVRMGERVLQIGVSDPGLLGGLAAKVGLSGTAAVAAFDDGDAQRAAEIGRKVGALIEVHDIDEGRAWPIGDAQFDMVVIDDTHDRFGDVESRHDVLKHAWRALRPGGRIEVIERPTSSIPDYRGVESDLNAAGFKPVRVLAERNRLRFVEGLRPAL